MTDFWTQLAARAVGQAPCVRPRLAPRFSPSTSSGQDPDLAWWERVAEQHTEPTDQEAQPGSMSASAASGGISDAGNEPAI